MRQASRCRVAEAEEPPTLNDGKKPALMNAASEVRDFWDVRIVSSRQARGLLGAVKESDHPGKRLLRRFQLALPHYRDSPSEALPRRDVTFVPRFIRVELGLPKIGVRLRRRCVTASFVPMPEAAIDKNRNS